MKSSSSMMAALACATIALLTSAAAIAGAQSRNVTPAQLALMPLPQASFGLPMGALPLASDSGVVTNAQAAGNANQQVNGSTLARLGRITGYTLDYGSSIPGGTGLSGVQTTVELYGDDAGAAKGLAFWRADEADTRAATAMGLSVSLTPLTVTGLGGPGFAEVGKATLKGKRPFYGGDVYFQNGSLLAEATVTASSLAVARKVVLSVATRLHARIQRVLAGHVRGLPVVTPVKTKPGPPPNGPSLAALALTPADLGSGKIIHQGYKLDTDLSPVSEYERDLAPGGPFAIVEDQVATFRSSAQASWALAVLGNFTASKQAWQTFGLGRDVRSFSPRPVAVQGGDEARATIGVARLANGTSFDMGFVLIRVGKTIEFVTVGTSIGTTLLPSALGRLTTITASREGRGLDRPTVA